MAAARVSPRYLSAVERSDFSYEPCGRVLLEIQICTPARSGGPNLRRRAMRLRELCQSAPHELRCRCAIGKCPYYHFKGISRDNRRFCSTTEMQKLRVFHGVASLGIRFFES